MKIRTQLFLGISALMFTLMGAQVWLLSRQMGALEGELSLMAAWVGKAVITSTEETRRVSVHTDHPIEPEELERLMRQLPPAPEPPAPPGQGELVWKTEVEEDNTAGKSTLIVRKRVETVVTGAPGASPGATTAGEPGEGEPQKVQDVHVLVAPREDGAEDEEPERILVIRGLPEGEKRIPLPESGAKTIVRTSIEQSLVVSAVLLLIGLGAAALFADRMSRPIRRLSAATGALSQGELGARVSEGSPGELGELERGFNQMSARLLTLTQERERWRAREHLAELGDVARGLGHTLRNPLHTLGLVVEELARGASEDKAEWVHVARAQIRRIDRWLQSFLSLGAGQSVEPSPVDVSLLVHDVALELTQSGADIEVQGGEGPLMTRGVAPALRAALSNLVENAVQASPPGSGVVVRLSSTDNKALIDVVDQGPGLPEEVRAQLFSPHVTTRVGGSGMGLFLARQLIETGHGGRLTLSSSEEGTTAHVELLRLSPHKEE